MATHRALQGAIADARLRAPRQWNRVVGHRGWLAVREQALAGLAQRPALVVILGEAGTGKTVLLRDLHRLLLESGISAQIVAPVVPPPPLGNADPNAVLLVDDASRLPDDELARLLADDRRLIVLADRADFAERLDGSPRSPLRLELMPLRADEVADFISASLPETEREVTLFSEQAATRLAERSAGVPRGLHSLAGMALLLANREQAEAVEPRHVDQACLVGESGLHAALMAVSPPRPSPVSLIAVAEPAIETGPPIADLDPAVFEPDLAGRERIVWRALAIGSACLVAGIVGWQFFPSTGPTRPPLMRPGATALLQPAPPTPDTAPRLAPDGPTQPPPRSQPAEIVPPELLVGPPLNEAPAAPPAEPPSAQTASTTVAPAPVDAPPAPAPPVDLSLAKPIAIEPEPGPVLPAAALTEISVRFPAGNAHAAHQAAALVSGLRTAGFAVAEPTASASRELPGVHYAFAEDREAADRVAGAANHLVANLSIVATRRKPAERDTPPNPGEVQIMVSGEGDSQ